MTKFKNIAELTAHYANMIRGDDKLTEYEKFGAKNKATKKKIARENLRATYERPRELDLHGRTLAEAENVLSDFFASHTGETVIVITGRSGKLRAVFPEWAATIFADAIAEYSLMHTGGSFRVRLKK